MANDEHLEILRKGVVEWNAWREENRDAVPDLSDADLSGGRLDHANLTNVILLGANLYGTSLIGAKLIDAKLDCCNLSGAHLIDADLSNAKLCLASLDCISLQLANLSNARLSGADLAFTNFFGANLTGAKLDATLGGSALSGVDLSNANGIESAFHRMPSCIGTDTLELTALGLTKKPANQGAVETFLRSAGLQEHAIAYFRSLIGKPIEFYSCFISYSHADKAFARRLYDALQSHGIRCWLDEHQLLPGDPIMQFVDRGIRLWDKVLLCCSEAALNSWWVKDEIRKAIQKERQLEHERGREVYSLVPLDLDGYLFSDEYRSEFESVLKERVAADFTGWEDNKVKFEEQCERVVKALRTGREEPPQSLL